MSNEKVTRKITPLPICKVKNPRLRCSRPPWHLIVFVGLYRPYEVMFLDPYNVNLLSGITEPATELATGFRRLPYAQSFASREWDPPQRGTDWELQKVFADSDPDACHFLDQSPGGRWNEVWTDPYTPSSDDLSASRPSLDSTGEWCLDRRHWRKSFQGAESGWHPVTKHVGQLEFRTAIRNDQTSGAVPSSGPPKTSPELYSGISDLSPDAFGR
ncbi:hypothetical protein BKA70DRAFT_1226060 [Coprinopsis sp. MPI-PUGE-AT-0042]|nr:hypothetical protein BKA70DRAFT_1226060 [Coprinopsis sp. MPI-PUGE-AT-0042]